MGLYDDNFTSCWKYDNDMKMALLGTKSGDFNGGLEVFGEDEQKLAVKHGVILKEVNVPLHRRQI